MLLSLVYVRLPCPLKVLSAMIEKPQQMANKWHTLAKSWWFVEGLCRAKESLDYEKK